MFEQKTLFTLVLSRAKRAEAFEGCIVGWVNALEHQGTLRARPLPEVPAPVEHATAPGLAPPELAKAIAFAGIPFFVLLQSLVNSATAFRLARNWLCTRRRQRAGRSATNLGEVLVSGTVFDVAALRASFSIRDRLGRTILVQAEHRPSVLSLKIGEVVYATGMLDQRGVDDASAGYRSVGATWVLNATGGTPAGWSLKSPFSLASSVLRQSLLTLFISLVVPAAFVTWILGGFVARATTGQLVEVPWTADVDQRVVIDARPAFPLASFRTTSEDWQRLRASKSTAKTMACIAVGNRITQLGNSATEEWWRLGVAIAATTLALAISRHLRPHT